MDIKKMVIDAVTSSNQLLSNEKNKILDKVARSNSKVIPIFNKTITINGNEVKNLDQVPMALKGLLANNHKNGIQDIAENALSQIGNANANTNIQNNPNYAVQDKSFNMNSGNSKTANNMKSGARNLSGGSMGQTNYSNANPNMFSQKAQPIKIGNGINTGLAKRLIKTVVNILILIAILGVVYYILVKYLGISVSVE